MAAYVVVGLNPKDTEKLQSYSAQAAPTIAKYEGEFLAKGEVQSLSGNYAYAVQVIIVFPDKERAESWYNSSEYQALIPLRDEGMDSHFQIID